jgi:hypothetical protein
VILGVPYAEAGNVCDRIVEFHLRLNLRSLRVGRPPFR